MDTDDLDIRMLEQLNDDGRQSYRKLAEELDVSPSTISARMRKMEHGSIVEGFRPAINYSAIGFDLTAIIEVAVSSDALAEGHEELTGLRNVTTIYEVTGEQDLILICKFRDRQEMNRTVKQVIRMDSVESTHTRVALTAPKEDAPLDLAGLMLEDETDG